jgi:hypothetical protein
MSDPSTAALARRVSISVEAAMQTCTAPEDACRYCGSSEIILWPVDVAGKCARCSWQAHKGRASAARMHDVVRRIERERYAFQGVHGTITLPMRRPHAVIGDGRALAAGGAR